MFAFVCFARTFHRATIGVPTLGWQKFLSVGGASRDRLADRTACDGGAWQTAGQGREGLFLRVGACEETQEQTRHAGLRAAKLRPADPFRDRLQLVCRRSPTAAGRVEPAGETCRSAAWGDGERHAPSCEPNAIRNRADTLTPFARLPPRTPPPMRFRTEMRAFSNFVLSLQRNHPTTATFVRNTIITQRPYLIYARLGSALG